MGFETSLFVDAPNETLFCGICADVLKQATTACSEGHAFCKGCLVPSVTCCPTCRGSLQKTNCLPLQRIIEALRVQCPNHAKEESGSEQPASKKRRKSATKSDACDWVGPLSELERHEKDLCKFHLVSCEHDGCKEKVFRKNLKKHASTCDCRPSECNKCKQRITHKLLREHQCPKEMTACSYCNKRMLRQELLGAGSPTFDETKAMYGFPLANNNKDDSDSDPTTPTSGSMLLSDIMKEHVRFVPTDAQCQGHYKVCPSVPLRCEFHEQGCTRQVLRKDLAQHHAESAQHHAALVARALCEIPARIEQRLSREHATIYFGLAAERFGPYHDYRNLVSGSVQVGPHDFRLKFHQFRNEQPIAVSIRANVGSAYAQLKIDLCDIVLRVTETCPTGNETDEQVESSGFFKCDGPHTMQRGQYGILEFKTQLCMKESDERTVPMTGTHITRLIEKSATNKLYVAGSFSVAKRSVKDLGGIYDTTSPCPSPSRDYADY